MPTRRYFLKSSAVAMFGLGAAPCWLTRTAYASDGPSARKKILVAVFQRGAVDGLNMIVPFGDPHYHEFRPNIAIPGPDRTQDSAVDLNGFFGLHPSLAALKPAYDERHLAIVHAVGSPDPTRSHFDAQDYMESGTPGLKATGDGWLNRTLQPERGDRPPLRAAALGTSLPRALRGANGAIAIDSLENFQVRDGQQAAAFETLYGSTSDQALKSTARETFEAVKSIQSIQKKAYVPANRASYPNGKFGQSMRQIARLIKADVGLEVAFADVGGWDTHVNEVGAKPAVGQLANLLTEFGQALAAFHLDLGDRMNDVAVVTMSEFGRTAKENGNRGTDHGHANVMLAMGGGVRGGAIYCDWPGLEPDKMYEGRDLAVTIDFRDVLGELVTRHLGNRDTAAVFPGYTPKFRNLISESRPNL